MKITHIKDLIAACRAIGTDPVEYIGDRYDWNEIAKLLERDTLQSFEAATDFYRSMDTASRDSLEQYARKDSNVKHQAEAALDIIWRF